MFATIMAEKASERSVLFQCLCRLIALYHVIVTYICRKKRGAKVKTLLPFEAVGLQFATLQSLHKDSYCSMS
jgi:hypothetical protein